MKVQSSKFKAQSWSALSLLGVVLLSLSTSATNAPTHQIDLATTLRLAGAQNLDVAIAQERVKEARAQHEQARMQFFPWIAPSIGYRRHDGNIQDVSGNIFDASKQSYGLGAALTAQVDLGDALYKSLATQQLARAAEEAAEARRQEVILQAAQGYFDLARAQASVGVAREALKISEDYASQVKRAVEAGIAFKGDAFRAEVQSQKNAMQLRAAGEQQQVASARLAQTLRLNPATQLTPLESEMAPLTLVDTSSSMDSLVTRALTTRPELRQFVAQAEAAKAARKGAQHGPWIPTVGAQASFGGLGGGRNDDWGNFDDTQDYFLGLSWRIGPGGLFDRSRVRAAESREKSSGLQSEKARDDVARQVIESLVRARSLGDQLGSARLALTAAEETLKLSRERKEFAVGAVLETIQAEEELTRVRRDYLTVIAEVNKAQFSLQAALGALDTTVAPSPTRREQ